MCRCHCLIFPYISFTTPQLRLWAFRFSFAALCCAVLLKLLTISTMLEPTTMQQKRREGTIAYTRNTLSLVEGSEREVDSSQSRRRALLSRALGLLTMSLDDNTQRDGDPVSSPSPPRIHSVSSAAHKYLSHFKNKTQKKITDDAEPSFYLLSRRRRCCVSPDSLHCRTTRKEINSNFQSRLCLNLSVSVVFFSFLLWCVWK